MVQKLRVGYIYRPSVTILRINDDNNLTRIRLGGREYQERYSRQDYRGHINKLEIGKIYRPIVKIVELNKYIPTLIRIGSKDYELDDGYYV